MITSSSLTLSEIVQTITEPTFFPMKDKISAKEARDLHVTFGHPNNFVLSKALDNGNLLRTHITSRYVKMPTSSRE